MAPFLRKNFSFGTLASDVAVVDTQITMTAGHGLPTDAGTFRVVVWDISTYENPADDPDTEIMTASYSGTPNIYDVTRAQESTTASAHVSGDQVAVHITAGLMDSDRFYVGDKEVDEAAFGEGKSLIVSSGKLVYQTPTVSSLDVVPDGTTYGRVRNSSLTGGEVVKLTDAAGDDLTVSLGGSNRVLTMSANVSLNQNLLTSSSPAFVTVDLTGVADGKIPYMSASGFAASPITVSGNNVGFVNGAPQEFIHTSGRVRSDLGFNFGGTNGVTTTAAGLTIQGGIVTSVSSNATFAALTSQADFGTTETSGITITNTGTASADDVSPLAFTTRSSSWGTVHAATIGAYTTSATDGGAYLAFKTSSTGQFSPTEWMRITNLGAVGFGETAPSTKIEMTDAAPYFTSHNSTHEDSDGGRESRWIAKGEQSGGEETTLGYIEFSHVGIADDQKGRFRIYTNAGSDGDTPTLAVTVTETQRVGVGTDDPQRDLHVTGRCIVGNHMYWAGDGVTEDWHMNVVAGDSIRMTESGVAVRMCYFEGGNIAFGPDCHILTMDTVLTLVDANPYYTLWNTTHEDTDGGRESRLNFKGEQSGGEITTLARIQVSHDGVVDDQKGKIEFYTNDGADIDAPTLAMTLDSAQRMVLGGHIVDPNLVSGWLAVHNSNFRVEKDSTDARFYMVCADGKRAFHKVQSGADSADFVCSANGGANVAFLGALAAKTYSGYYTEQTGDVDGFFYTKSESDAPYIYIDLTDTLTNIGLFGPLSFNSVGSGVLAMGLGTAPDAGLGDAVQLTCVDRTAGEAGLMITSESGKKHLFSDRVSFGWDSPDLGPFEVHHSAGNMQNQWGCWSATSGHRALLYFTKSGSNTIGTYSVTADGENIGTIVARGVNSSSAAANCADILFRQDGAAGATFVPGKVMIRTGSASAGLVEQFTVREDGGIYAFNLKSGATAAAAGAGTNELWVTASHATLPDNVVMIG